MKSFKKLCLFGATCTFIFVGCGSPASDAPIAHEVKPSLPDQKEKPDQKANLSATAGESAQSSVADSAITADDGTAIPLPSSAEKNNSPQASLSKPTTPAQVQVAPSTANDAIAIVNLLDLPKLEEKAALQKDTTYLYYTAASSLKDADTFYKNLFESRGWKEIPSLSAPTEQFVDRLFEKSGYFVRATLSIGSEPNESSIMLANLGNVDVRSLPKLSDADIAGAPSTPVNFTYKTASTIPDAADALLQQMIESGWQRCDPFQESPIDVPHYRDMHFRREACRLNVGIMKNPQSPADETTVFYHAESLTPFDIPTLDVSQAIKLDVTAAEARFSTNDSRKDLVSVLQTNSQKFGWKLGPTDKFEAGEEHMVPINVKSGAYVIARLVESGGKYFGSIENFASPPRPKKAEPEMTASNQSEAKSQAIPASNAALDNLNAQIESEIAKALGSLNSPESKAPMDLEALQAMAKGLTEKMNSDKSDVAPQQSKNLMPLENPFDIAEDTTEPSAEFLSIKKSFGTLKHGGKSIELGHVACYVVKSHGDATKCVIFSDRPIDVEKLKRELLKEGGPINQIDVSENASNVLQFRVTEDTVSIDAQLGDLSLGIPTFNVKGDIFYVQGKIAGKIFTTEPIDIGDGLIEFTSQVNQPVIEVDWANRKAP